MLFRSLLQALPRYFALPPPSSWLDQKTQRMAQEEKQASKRRKTLERELEWIRMAPKARQAKGKARLNSYESLLNEDQKERETKLEIFILNGPRLGNKVIEAHDVAKAFGDKNSDLSMPARLIASETTGTIFC